MANGKRPVPTNVLDAIIIAFDSLAHKLAGVILSVFGAIARPDEDVFWYVIRGPSTAGGVGFVTLSNVVGNPVTGTVVVNADGDFVLTRWTFITTDAAGVLIATPSLTVQVQSDGSGGVLMDGPVHIGALMGDGRQSVPLPKSRLFRAKETITFNFVQLQAVTTNVRVVLHGYKKKTNAGNDEMTQH